MAPRARARVYKVDSAGDAFKRRTLPRTMLPARSIHDNPSSIEAARRALSRALRYCELMPTDDVCRMRG
jgi:hypothetical protein